MRSASQPRRRFAKLDAWPRSLAGRVVVPIITLLLGMVLGFMALLLYVVYALSNAAPESPVPVPPPPSSGDIVVQISPTYMGNVLKPLLQKELSGFRLPGNIQLPGNIRLPGNIQLPGNINKVQVQLSDSDRLGSVQVTTIADYEVPIPTSFSILFRSTKAHVTVTPVAQLFIVQHCQLKAKVLSLVFLGVPIVGSWSPPTTVRSALEEQINRQLPVKTNGLPPGFVYCIIGIHSKPGGLFVTLSATPE